MSYDINRLKEFARETRFGVTGPLTHEDVTQFANSWLPQIRFHERELFHPISLATFLNGAADAEEDDWIDGMPPPAIVSSHGGRVLGSLSDPSIEHNSYITNLASHFEYENLVPPAVKAEAQHLARYARAKKYFGANDVTSGFTKPRFPLVILAECKLLLETLQHNLLAELSVNYPRRGPLILDAIRNDLSYGTTREEKAAILNLIRAHESGNAALEGILLKELQDWRLADEERGHVVISEAEWTAIKTYAVLEYYFVFQYNDFDQYSWFGNYHEGDIEGCCLFFHRDKLLKIDEQPDRSAYLRGITPECVVTVVHEDAKNDEIKFFPEGHSTFLTHRDLTVWVALGSHATYLSEGTHDVVDFADVVTKPWTTQSDGVTAFCVVVSGFCALGSLIFAIIEHFADIEDQTSSNGAYTGAPGLTGPLRGESDVQFFEPRIDVTPLSFERNIYQDEDLPKRAFPGKWGVDDSFMNHSWHFQGKTQRYLRTLVRNL